ncbi:MAG: dsDNA nuclease domain-containing protein, partial [Candidatus Hermodarchaeota archaeon]
MSSQKKITASGTDVNRGISYQKCCVLKKFLKEFNNQNFLKIIIEAPENEIEDINCIFTNRVEFIQIKKMEGDRWTIKNLERRVIKLFLKIYNNLKEIYYQRLNITYNGQETQFGFYTNA